MRVLVVDDDQLVTESLKMILEAAPDIQVVGLGQNGEAAVKLYAELLPDVLLMDIRMEPTSGLKACERILQRHPQARVLFLTTFLDDQYIVHALRLGAKGYMLKQQFASIVPALRAVHLGQSVFGDQIVSKLPDLLRGREQQDWSALGVNEKELEIISLVATGQSNREIGETLYLSEGTVRNYVSVILEKLHLRDRTQLAVFYLNRGR